MRTSPWIDVQIAANRLARQFDAEQTHLIEVVDELRPGSDGIQRWSFSDQAILLVEARRSMDRMSGLVERLRALQQVSDPEMFDRIEAVLFAAEMSIDTAGVAVEQLRDLPIDWRPSAGGMLPVH